MEKIASFCIDHEKLLPGLYVSRKDRRDGVIVTTFDLRFVAPNREPVIDMPALHTIEHVGATFLRNGERKDDVVYFGPMGCRTGFYLLMFGDLTAKDVLPLVEDMCRFVLGFEGEIPGAKPSECGQLVGTKPCDGKVLCREISRLARKTRAYRISENLGARVDKTRFFETVPKSFSMRR